MLGKIVFFSALMAALGVVKTSLPANTNDNPRVSSGVPTTTLNEQRWFRAKIETKALSEVKLYGDKIINSRDRYSKVSEQTGVPWSIIAVIHYRESTLNFKAHLHEGSPLTARTKYVPKGRPTIGNPPFAWEYSAVDALCYDKFNKVGTWTLGTTLDMLERYNGLGYRSKGRSSPYLFSKTTEQQSGKYVADNKFDINAWDKQLGVVALLKYLEQKGYFRVETNRRISI